MFGALILTGFAIGNEMLKKDTESNKYLISSLTFAVATIISMINFTIGKVIRFFGAYEKHTSRTEYVTSVAEKLTIVKIFLN